MEETMSALYAAYVREIECVLCVSWGFVWNCGSSPQQSPLGRLNVRALSRSPHSLSHRWMKNLLWRQFSKWMTAAGISGQLTSRTGA